MFDGLLAVPPPAEITLVIVLTYVELVRQLLMSGAHAVTVTALWGIAVSPRTNVDWDTAGEVDVDTLDVMPAPARVEVELVSFDVMPAPARVEVELVSFDVMPAPARVVLARFPLELGAEGAMGPVSVLNVEIELVGRFDVATDVVRGGLVPSKRLTFAHA